MVKKKKQKVRFHKGDSRQAKGLKKKLTYSVEMVKRRKEDTLACIRRTN